MDKVKIPTWLETKKDCCVCSKATNLAVQTRKGNYFLCSDQCQMNFNLQTGINSVNQVRYHDKPVTVGKLQNLTAEEIKNLMQFNKTHNKESMRRLKSGDSLDRVIGIMFNKGKKQNKVKKVG